jgi:polyphosphate:AMP phosphotransferase
MRLEDADLNAKLSKEEAERVMPPLRARLGELQRQAREKKAQIVITFDGWDTLEMADYVNEVIRALDPRGFDLYSMEEPNDEEREHGFLWRFVRRLPADGRIAIFDRSWYSHAAAEAVEGGIKVGPRIQHISGLEWTLADRGTIFVKLFFHIGKKDLRRRIEKAKAKESEKSCGNGRSFFKREKYYDDYAAIIEEIGDGTDRPWSEWQLIPAEDDRYGMMRTFETIISTIEKRLVEPYGSTHEITLPQRSDRIRLEDVDLSRSLTQDEYRSRIKDVQKDLAKAQCALKKNDKALVVAMEGWDAAGKGGAILRVTDELNPRLYRVVPVGAPNDIEKSHHYLWRFSIAMPQRGHMAIFDRSWYGRVLVERVEGLCSQTEWKQAYREINAMEARLAAEGSTIVKIWLQIDKETQLRRFKERESDPEKQWKITDDDWRNRAKWEAYEVAIQDMFRYTDTDVAPWTVIESNDKYYSRMKVIETILAAAKRG